MKNTIYATLLVLVFCLTSCVNIKEEIWIEQKNKVTVDYSIHVPATDNMFFASMIIQSLMQNVVSEFSGGRTNISVNLNFNGSLNPSDTIIYIKEMESWNKDSILFKVNEIDERNVFSTKAKKEFASNLYAVGNKSSIKLAYAEGGDIEVGFRIQSEDYKRLASVGKMIKQYKIEYPDNDKNGKLEHLRDNFWFKLEGNQFSRGKLMSPSDIDTSKFNLSFGDQSSNVGESLLFTSIIHLPRNVKALSNKEAVKTDKKTVELKCSIQDLSDGKTLENKIKF